MTTYNTLTPELEDTIELEMIHGYRDEDGKKEYPTLKSSATWYNVSYNSLKKIAPSWNWKQKREDQKVKVARKTAQKKKSEDISAAEIEELVVDDFKHNKSANRLRRGVDLELEKIINEDVYLYTDNKTGEAVYGYPSNAAYRLMNLGKALESSQKVAKTAAGEPSDIAKIEGSVQKYKDEFDGIMDSALENLESDEGNSEKVEPVVAKPAGIARGTRRKINLG